MAYFNLGGPDYEPPDIVFGGRNRRGDSASDYANPGTNDPMFDPGTGFNGGVTNLPEVPQPRPTTPATGNEWFTLTPPTPSPTAANDIISQYRNANTASIGGMNAILQNLRTAGVNASPYMYGNIPSNNELNIGGTKTKIIGNEDSSVPYWYTGGNDSGGGGGGGGGFGGGGGYGAQTGGLFDDPATAEFMKLLMSRINALNTPYQPPSYGPLTDYLKSYFEKLQGPAYTPQQMDLLQTQSLDPLSRERDAARQRVVEQASARGLTPQSGIIQKQLSDLDQSFEQLRTKTQAGFASNAVNLDRINAQQAAGVGQLLANIEQAGFNQNEQRANQALGYAQLPQEMVLQRLGAAGGLLNQNALNPSALLSNAQGFGQLGLSQDAQTQQFLAGLASLIPGLLQSFGLGR